MSHIPGPWKVTVNPTRGLLVKGPHADVIMRHPLTKSWKRNQELYATACLIAAAPELLEVFEEALVNVELVTDRGREAALAVAKWLEKARAILAKARGDEGEER